MIPEFSVVVPTCQSPAALLNCLNALSRQTLPRNQFEIIVVDDGNAPDTEKAVSLFACQIARLGGPLEIRYLGQSQGRGPAAARNRGWRAARGRIVAFTDDDCLPQPNWLSAALVGFRRGAQVMTGQLRLTLPDGRKPYVAESLYMEMGELTSANCFCRKSVLERVGGFEEAFDLAWREDSDLLFKFMQAGIPIGKSPEAVVVHPMHEPSWHASLTNERRNRYDALLYKRHPALFRQRIGIDRMLVLQYYASVLGMTTGVAGALSGRTMLTAAGFGLWGLLSASMIWQRLPEQLTGSRLQQTVLTSLAVPFLSVYWRLYGAVKYKVLYW